MSYPAAFRFLLPVLVLCTCCLPLAAGQKASEQTLVVGTSSPLRLADIADDERLWEAGSDRTALLSAIDASLRYLQTSAAERAYQVYQANIRQQRATPGSKPVTRERVRNSLRRLRYLVKAAQTPTQLETALQREFVLYEPAGEQPVHFTGYYEPLYPASRVRTAVFRWPLYRPVTTRLTRPELEGKDGVAPPNSPLRGHELIYLQDRMAAFLVQVQGSARLQLPDGRIVRVSNAGTNGQPYTSIGRQLVRDGKIAEAELTLPLVIAWMEAHPKDLSEYLPRNQRLVFFGWERDTGRPPLGSAGVSLTPERSIATDKRRLPPGAPALLRFDFRNPAARAVWGRDSITRVVLDQDAGSAILGPARVDLYVGGGSVAERRAGVLNARGRLAYLLLR